MIYCQLGKSPLRVSRIAFGCMSLKGINTANEKLLDRAAASGINFFDTADLYDKGQNEELVGKALKHRRKEIILATKAGNQWRADGSGWDWNPRKDHILKAAEESLKRLQTDYIDLYQLHGGTMDDPAGETIEAFEQLLQQGKIRSYGISSIRPNVIRKWTEQSSISTVMMQYSLLDRRPEEESLGLLHAKGISVLVRGSLAQGLLAGKPPKDYLGYSASQVQSAASALKDLAGADPVSTTAIRFVLSHPAIAAAVVGIRTVAQLDEALRIPDAPLPQEQYSSLAALLPANVYADHR